MKGKQGVIRRKPDALMMKRGINDIKQKRNERKKNKSLCKLLKWKIQRMIKKEETRKTNQSYF